MKHTLTCFLIICYFLIHFSAGAQTVAVGVKGGISIPNLTAGGGSSNPLNTGYSSRLGIDAAAFAEIRFSTLFSIQPMIEYSAQGGKKSGLQAFPTPPIAATLFPGRPVPPYLYANFKNEIQINYLMLPVLAKVGWNIGASPLRVYADAGPFAALMLSAKDVTSGSSAVYLDAAGRQPVYSSAQSFNSNVDAKDSLNKFNAGIEANIGVAYVAGKCSVFAEGGGNYGFINIQKRAANGKNNTGAATVTIGFSYRFGE